MITKKRQFHIIQNGITIISISDTMLKNHKKSSIFNSVRLWFHAILLYWGLPDKDL